MGNALNNGTLFLVSTIFDLCIFIVLLRILFIYFGVHFFNPVVQFVARVTTPFIRPVQRVLPKYKQFDLAAIVLVFTLELIKFSLLYTIAQQFPSQLLSLLILSAADIINQLVYIFIFSILIMVAISWLNPGLHNPLTDILHQFTEPLLRPARQLIPPIGGFDLSIIPVLIFLRLVTIIIVSPLMEYFG